MRAVLAILKRELFGYFSTPVAYVFIVIFLALNGVMTFMVGGLYQRGQADLAPFFDFHPWLYLFLIPAVAMRLWAEERRSGTIELLMTLPMPIWASVVGKFLAAWAFTGVALLLTFPVWITVNYLGSPDNGAIFTGYFGSFLMAGSFLAVGSCVSAATKSQVIAFVLSVVACFALLLAGLPPVLDFFSGAPKIVIDAVSSFSVLTHFGQLSKGVIDARDVVFFLSLIVLALAANTVLVDLRKAA